VASNTLLGAGLVLAAEPLARATRECLAALVICIATSTLIPPQVFEEVFLRCFGRVSSAGRR